MPHGSWPHLLRSVSHSFSGLSSRSCVTFSKVQQWCQWLTRPQQFLSPSSDLTSVPIESAIVEAVQWCSTYVWISPLCSFAVLRTSSLEANSHSRKAKRSVHLPWGWHYWTCNLATLRLRRSFGKHTRRKHNEENSYGCNRYVSRFSLCKLSLQTDMQWFCYSI